MGKWADIGTATKVWVTVGIMAIGAATTGVFQVAGWSSEVKKMWGQEAQNRAEVVVEQKMAPMTYSMREIEAGQKFDRCLKIGPREIERPEDWIELFIDEQETWCDAEQEIIKLRWKWEDCELAGLEVNMDAEDTMKMCRSQHGPDPREP
jgi:hypothetical protein